MDWKHKRIALTGMWLASLVGAIYGLLFTIIGAGFDWGPGSGLDGPYWLIVIMGIISIVIGMYTGELVVRKLSVIVFKKPRSYSEITFMMFIICIIASFLAWVLSWEAGFISGILLGSLQFEESASWFEIIYNVGLMSAVFGTPFYVSSGGLAALFSYSILRK
jgi:hypothetical protein